MKLDSRTISKRVAVIGQGYVGPLRGSKILILEDTYKPNIADQCESPDQSIASLLTSRGAKVSFHDPRVEKWEVARQSTERVKDLDRAVPDAVLLLQAPSECTNDLLASEASLFFNTRGASAHDHAIRL